MMKRAFVIASLFAAGCATLARGPETLIKARALTQRAVTEPVGFDVYHSQGLVVTADTFYLTSVNKAAKEGWIFKLDRSAMALQSKRNLAVGEDIHPGGMDFDGQLLWVPVAAYTRNSHTTILALDPETLAESKRFEWDDHIGAVARYKDLLIGANWDAEDFYFWTLDGELVEQRKSPTGIAYQDCEGAGKYLVGVGGGYLDWIDVESWTLAKRLPLRRSLQGSKLSREGMSLFRDSVFFFPDDGPEARVYEYRSRR
jgi:Family of unknown function (DUF6454)